MLHCTAGSATTVILLVFQGKSRSATAVIAYVMATQGKSYRAALEVVQSQRKMAEPNPTFEERLMQFEKSDFLRQLQLQLQ